MNNKTVQDIMDEISELGLCECESTFEPMFTIDVKLPSGEIIDDALIYNVHEKYFNGNPPKQYFMFENDNTDVLGMDEVDLGANLNIAELRPGRWAIISV